MNKGVRNLQYNFPCVLVQETRISFNKPAALLIKADFLKPVKGINRFYFFPGGSNGGLRIHRQHGGHWMYITSKDLVEQSGLIVGRHYKLYAAGDAFAIKRYEPLEEVDADGQKDEPGRGRAASQKGATHH